MFGEISTLPRKRKDTPPPVNYERLYNDIVANISRVNEILAEARRINFLRDKFIEKINEALGQLNHVLDMNSRLPAEQEGFEKRPGGELYGLIESQLRVIKLLNEIPESVNSARSQRDRGLKESCLSDIRTSLNEVSKRITDLMGKAILAKAKREAGFDSTGKSMHI